MPPEELFQMTVHLHYETEKAVFVSTDGAKEQAFWLPKSMLDLVLAPKRDKVTVTMPEWLAVRRGLALPARPIPQ